MKYCPKCGRRYESDLKFCLDDGSALPQYNPEVETLKLPNKNPQRQITFIQKTEVLNIGDYIDFETPQFSCRIELNGLVEDKLPNSLFDLSLTEKTTAAHLILSPKSAEGKMGMIHSGSRIKVVSLNEFVMPKAEPEDDESRSVFFFYLGEKLALVFRLFVKHINKHSGKAELKVAYFRYEPD